jgi:hypothetical protein
MPAARSKPPVQNRRGYSDSVGAAGTRRLGMAARYRTRLYTLAE